MKAMFSSARGDWQTPDMLLELVRQVGRIKLDPCTSEDNPTKAERFYTYSGLVEPWDVKGGIVYVNPPYGRQLGSWVNKTVQEAARSTEIILLVPSRTDTRWFRDIVESAYALAFWHGRLRFKGAKAPAPFPSLLAYWGPDTHRFVNTFCDKAEVWRLA